MTSVRDPEAKRAYQREWYRLNRERTAERTTARHKANRDRNFKIIDDLRDNTPCMDCGIQYPHYVMDFDHVRGVKINDVTLGAAYGWSTEKLMAEVAKCEIVCSNCHRARTWQRRASA